MRSFMPQDSPRAVCSLATQGRSRWPLATCYWGSRWGRSTRKDTGHQLQSTRPRPETTPENYSKISKNRSRP